MTGVTGRGIALAPRYDFEPVILLSCFLHPNLYFRKALVQLIFSLASIRHTGELPTFAKMGLSLVKLIIHIVGFVPQPRAPFERMLWRSEGGHQGSNMRSLLHNSVEIGYCGYHLVTGIYYCD